MVRENDGDDIDSDYDDYDDDVTYNFNAEIRATFSVETLVTHFQ
jgi:hypothetical protein